MSADPRLTELESALDTLPDDDARRSAVHFLLGYLSGRVPSRTWTAGIAAMLTSAQKIRGGAS